MIRRFFKEWFLSAIAWVIITNLYALAIITNLKILLSVAHLNDATASNEILSYATSNYQFLEATVFGLIFGSLFFLINRLIDRLFAPKLPFGKIIVLKTIMYLVAMAVVFFIMWGILRFLYFYPIDVHKLMQESREAIDPGAYISILIFILFTSALVNFLIQVVYKFGPKIVFPMMMGKYHKPRSEDRIFLFLDLKDSTGIAEELGHMKYSRLLQDCYHDLNKIVFKVNTEIYQYVGDEVVLTWVNKKDYLNKYAIKTTFEFKRQIEKRRHYYLKNYGLVPEFKGGLNLGKVSVAEIGEIKRDIAYHGDVINTASRLQEAAKQYGKNLMVSRKVIDELSENNGFYIEEMPTIELKGKKKKVDVFCVEEFSGKEAEKVPVA